MGKKEELGLGSRRGAGVPFLAILEKKNLEAHRMKR